MPLRDHFRPPVSTHHSWEGFHGLWPGMLVQRLALVLPEGYVAEPRVHLGAYFEIDVAGYESDLVNDVSTLPSPIGEGGVATAPWAPTRPTLSVETHLPEQYEYEVQVYDLAHNRRLVAAVEIVSPANKDRPESRRTFVAKMATLLQQGVCVSVVDLVTVRQFNLYADLLGLIGQSDPALSDTPPPLYAATCRGRIAGGRGWLDAWYHPLTLSQPLPTLPLWLNEETYVSLDLEASYEETCRVLRIR